MNVGNSDLLGWVVVFLPVGRVVAFEFESLSACIH